MIEFETLRSGYDYYHSIDVKNLCFAKHTHRSYEIVFVNSGELEINIEDKLYVINAGKGILIAPYEIHSFVPLQGNRVFTCIFSPEMVRDFYDFTKDKQFLDPVFDFADSPNELLDEKLDNYFEKISVLYAVCSKVLKNGIERKKEIKNYNLLSKISQYLSENIANDISLKTLCKELGYSYNYISSIFKANFGMNFSSYVNQIRLETASHLLISTNLTASQISDQCGYKTIRNFNFAFKNYYHTTPTKYRLLYRGEDE